MNQDPDTDTEPATHLDGLENCGLHKRTPYGITGVSHGMFSIARHYGAATYQGDAYTYFPDTDELVRDDVLKWKKAQQP